MFTAKNAAAYQVSRSAVKNVHVANNGIDNRRHTNPAHTNNCGLRDANRAPRAMKKSISCGFMGYRDR